MQITKNTLTQFLFESDLILPDDIETIEEFFDYVFDSINIDKAITKECLVTTYKTLWCDHILDGDHMLPVKVVNYISQESINGCVICKTCNETIHNIFS